MGSRRQLRALLAAAALLAASCSRAEPTWRVRVLDRALEGSFALDPARAAPRPLLDGGALGPGDWRPLIRIGEEPGADELEDFRATSSVLADGSVELGAAWGSYLTGVAVEGGTTVVLEGRVETHGFAEENSVAGAQLWLLELDVDALPADSGELAAHVIASTASRILIENGVLAPRLFVHTDPRTRAVAVMCSFSHEAELPDARARFTDLSLRAASELDLVAELSHEPTAPLDGVRPVPARYEIEATSRHGVAVLPGADVRLPFAPPEAPFQLELAAGLVPGEAFPPGASVELSVTWEQKASERLLWRERLSSGDIASARWLEARLEDLDLAGAGMLILRARAADATPCLPVVAGLVATSNDAPRTGPNLLLVSLDTVRADHVGCYGYARDTTPNIDAFAESALVFLDTWAPSTFTLPSHVSLFSGQAPSVHGVQRPANRLDPVRSPPLAELLARAGWRTGAFTGGAMVLPDFGFARGFERYGTIDPGMESDDPRFAELAAQIEGLTPEVAARSSVDAALRWIEERRDESFFLFFHTYAAHEFSPPRRHLEALGVSGHGLERDPALLAYLGNRRTPPPEARAYLVDLYDGGVRHADELVGRLLAQLDALDLAGNTVVVVTSDHGKELGDHGLVGHGHTLYEELLEIPLLVRIPGVAPARVREPVMLVDVLPTVLQALDLPLPGPVQGRSLLEPGLAADRPQWAEIHCLAAKSALREGDMKTIWSPLDAPVAYANEVASEHYDLAADPDESRPLPTDEAQLGRLEELRRDLRTLGRALGAAGGADRALSDAARARLEALGYTVGRGD